MKQLIVYYFVYLCIFLPSAVFLRSFRPKISINEFVPETYKLMNATEKVKFVNDIYKGECLLLSIRTKFEHYRFTIYRLDLVPQGYVRFCQRCVRTSWSVKISCTAGCKHDL